MPKKVKVPTPRTLGRCLASRRLRLPGRRGRPVTIRIGIPRKLRDGWGYGCPVEIRGLDAPELRYIFGVDEFQSLQLVLEYIAIVTDAARPRPFLFDPDPPFGGTGFSRTIPSHLPPDAQDKVQALIERLTAKMLAGIKWRGRRPRRA